MTASEPLYSTISIYEELRHVPGIKGLQGLIMTTELCLFCSGKEKNYKPEPETDFICDLCVVLLAGAEQDDLKKAHAKAIEKGFKDKASAIESFIIPEVIDGKRPAKKHGRHSDRKRIVRDAGNKKERIKRVQTQTQAAVL